MIFGLFSGFRRAKKCRWYAVALALALVFTGCSGRSLIQNNPQFRFSHRHLLPAPANTSILLETAPPLPPFKKKFLIARSAHLGFGEFLAFNRSLEAQNYAPVVASRCLQQFRREILSLPCEHDAADLAALHTALRKANCGEYLYQQREKNPLFIYGHMMGLGFSAEEPFAVEMIKLAQVFGFAFHHPFSEEHPSPINGYDPLRPALYARSGDFMGSRMFSRRDYSQQIAAVLGKSELNKEEKNRNLAGIMPSVHAAHPEIRATFSEEARRCCSLSEKEQGKRSHNSDYFLGAWPALLQALHAVLDPRHQPAVIFCYGGRHKTGMLSLALRYLQDPRWYFGPRQTRGIFPKLDSSLFLEQVSSEAGAWGVRSRRMHKRQALALILRGKVYEAMGRRDLSLLARYRQVALNPAEQEYAGHNPGEFRLVNLSSLRSMFRLLWANSPEFEAALLRHNEGFLSKEDLERIKTELDQLRQKMQRLVTRAG